MPKFPSLYAMLNHKLPSQRSITVRQRLSFLPLVKPYHEDIVLLRCFIDNSKVPNSEVSEWSYTKLYAQNQAFYDAALKISEDDWSCHGFGIEEVMYSTFASIQSEIEKRKIEARTKLIGPRGQPSVVASTSANANRYHFNKASKPETKKEDAQHHTPPATNCNT